MKAPKLLAISLALMALAACSSSGVREEYSADGKITAREYKGADASYLAYVAAVTQQAPDSGVDANACAGDARCVENLAAFAALRALAGSNRHAVAPPTPKRTMGDRFESIAKATIGVLPGLGGIYSGIENAKQGRREREALYGTFASFGDNLVTLGATPTYSSGGDIITGTRTETNVADSYNDSSDNSTRGDEIAVSGDGSAVGDGNETINGDNAGNSGNIGEGNRQGSDDNSNDGDECSGVDCQSTAPPPEPIDPGF